MTEFDLPVASHMVAPVQTLPHTERLAQAARRMEELGVSALPIVDGSGRLTGVLERADLMRSARLRHRPAHGEPQWWWPDLSVAECMQTAVPIIASTQPLRQCAQRMLERRLSHVYVLAGDELAGVISTRELQRAVARAGLDVALRQLAEELAEPIAAGAPLSQACTRFQAGSGQPLVVVDDDAPVGIFAQSELQACLEADPRLATSLFMDDRVILLPADLAARYAARRAIAFGARYIIASDPPHGYRVVSGASFAACVAGVTGSGPQGSRSPAAAHGAAHLPSTPPADRVRVPVFLAGDARGGPAPAPAAPPPRPSESGAGAASLESPEPLLSRARREPTAIEHRPGEPAPREPKPQ
jgi:CBS domain-containing protein